MNRRIFHWVVVLAILVASFASTGSVSAWSSCSSYITVQKGDTLSGIALLCGTTVDAIRTANPGLGWWVYVGQVLYIPTGYSTPDSPPSYGGTYTVRWGDTLGKIAARAGIRLSSLLAVNPQIANPSLIYAGQIINLPSGVIVGPPPHTPPPHTRPPSQPADSLATLKVAYKYGLYIRSSPGGAIIASALNRDTLYYRTNSVFTDGNWKVWVEVRVYPPTKGYYTGWILVKDQLGNYFTEPQIGN